MLKIAFVAILELCSSTIVLAQDFCEMAMEKVYDKDSDLIAVVKVNTNKKRLYSSIVEASKTVKALFPSFQLKILMLCRQKLGFAWSYPLVKLNLIFAVLRVKLCLTEGNCQSLDIHLSTKDNRYIAAEPAFYEMTFE